jgi:phenylpropionate dioxygenase-like ring-hydroxylating dioxygenase large terminal subunit
MRTQSFTPLISTLRGQGSLPLDVTSLIEDRTADGVFRVHADVFRDPAVFAREMAVFFERGWVFVGHASQLGQPHDFLRVSIGRTPLLLMRDGEGRLGAFVNACRHKGALLCAASKGRRRAHVCPYHGWSYGSDGRCIAIRDHEQGAYAPAFDRAADADADANTHSGNGGQTGNTHGLLPVARFAEYRGFLFVSLDPDAPSLDEHLGEVRTLIDLVVDQAPQGLELVPGNVRYTFRGNWKLQLENSLDAYHFLATHPSYLRLLERRSRMPGRTDVAQAIWQGLQGGQSGQDKPDRQHSTQAPRAGDLPSGTLEPVVDDADTGGPERMGAFGLPGGHAMVWTTSPVRNHPLYPQRETLAARVGATRTGWMMRTRQLNVFPNLQLASNAALQMRVITPLAPDLTEVASYCLAPVGEDDEARARRLRQYEDFFNPSGLATPDDTVTFEDVQRGLSAPGVTWLQGHARGMTRVRAGADEAARSLGIEPDTSVTGLFDLSDETVFHTLYRHWQRRMEEAG